MATTTARKHVYRKDYASRRRRKHKTQVPRDEYGIPIHERVLLDQARTGEATAVLTPSEVATVGPVDYSDYPF